MAKGNRRESSNSISTNSINTNECVHLGCFSESNVSNGTGTFFFSPLLSFAVFFLFHFLFPFRFMKIECAKTLHRKRTFEGLLSSCLSFPMDLWTKNICPYQSFYRIYSLGSGVQWFRNPDDRLMNVRVDTQQNNLN